MTVAIVTDSTAYLPSALVAEHRITVVPLHVVINGAERAEGDDVSSDEIADALRRHRPVTTSRPSPATFERVYRDLVDGGATAVVSVHLSGELSGTVDAATSAARIVTEATGVAIRVVDSRTLAL